MPALQYAPDDPSRVDLEWSAVGMPEMRCEHGRADEIANQERMTALGQLREFLELLGVAAPLLRLGCSDSIGRRT
jgi:hypothetical protein